MISLDADLYREWLTTPLPMLALTLGAFSLGNWAYRRSGAHALVHPSLIGAILIAAVLLLFGVTYRDYSSCMQLFYLLMGTATVALAVPLYTHLTLIRELALPILVTVVLGAAVGSLSTVALAWLLDCGDEVLRSLASKSVTTPIALGITRELGGITELTNGAVLSAAVIGIVSAPICFRLFNIRDARARGMALGIAAHGMGASRAFELNAVTGAFASLSLCLTGVVSAIAIPLIVHWLQ
jgi:putative effector of murein hydrolase